MLVIPMNGLLRRPWVEFPSVITVHVTGRFCNLTPKPSLKIILTIIVVHLKWLSMNVRNSTFTLCICMPQMKSLLAVPSAKYGLVSSFPPITSLRMERL